MEPTSYTYVAADSAEFFHDTESMDWRAFHFKRLKRLKQPFQRSTKAL
jgi:hypothetical protein